MSAIIEGSTTHVLMTWFEENGVLEFMAERALINGVPHVWLTSTMQYDGPRETEVVEVILTEREADVLVNTIHDILEYDRPAASDSSTS